MRLPSMTNTRRLNLGAVSLVKGRVRNDIQTMTVVRDQIESALGESGWFPLAPFNSVSLIIRYGTKTDLTPIFQGINKRYEELQVAVELDMKELRMAHREPGKLESIVRKAISASLYGVAHKYDLSTHFLEQYLSQYNDA
jgi:hypothetical protein